MVCQITFSSPEYDEAVALRYEVLRKPLEALLMIAIATIKPKGMTSLAGKIFPRIAETREMPSRITRIEIVMNAVTFRPPSPVIPVTKGRMPRFVTKTKIKIFRTSRMKDGSLSSSLLNIFKILFIILSPGARYSAWIVLK